MRLIDADALIDDIQRYANEPIKLNDRRWDTKCVAIIQDMIGTVKLQPTIEAEPVRRGRWIPVDSYSAFGGSEEVWRAHGNPTAYHYCSECKEQSRLEEFGNEILSKYCPDCGARMDGREE